jgi:hypothetical protein
VLRVRGLVSGTWFELPAMYAEAVAAYGRRWPRVTLPEQQPAVRISLL